MTLCVMRNPHELRGALSTPLDELPDEVIHGPAAADRLRLAGVTDEPLLTAIAFHSLGSPDFDDMGKSALRGGLPRAWA